MYTRAELEKKTLKELKAIVTEFKLDEPWKDKRAKTTWIELILFKINHWENFIKEMLERFPEKWVRSVCQSISKEKPLAAKVLEEVVKTCLGQYTDFACLIGHEALLQGELVEAASGYRYIGLDDRGLPIAIQAEDDPTEIYAVSEKDKYECHLCERDGFLSDAGVVWECSLCEGKGYLDLARLLTFDEEVLKGYWGKTNAIEAFKVMSRYWRPFDNPTGMKPANASTSLEIGSTVAHKCYPDRPLGNIYKFFNSKRVGVDGPNGRNSYLVKNLVAARSPPG